VVIPEHIETPRLLLRKPRPDDAEAVFSGWASDPLATRYLSWNTHASPADTVEFLRFSDDHWSRWPLGPLLIERRESGEIIGSSGLTFESSDRAELGYVLSRHAWGSGYATECVRAVLEVAQGMAPLGLFACVHPENTASMRVLEKCGFISSGIMPAYASFPNLHAERLCDVAAYSYDIGPLA
jgi:RimJ/RimL family protein N-acetyltransferase